MREDFIHGVLRDHLRARGWRLLAGQYPNGSDDELPTLRILDPMLAKDRSPDPRRHSQNKLVPDLVAERGGTLLVLEIKPSYSAGDEEKLDVLLRTRRADLNRALETLAEKRRIELPCPPAKLRVYPGLGFGGKLPARRNPNVGHFLVDLAGKVSFEGPHEIG